MANESEQEMGAALQRAFDESEGAWEFLKRVADVLPPPQLLPAARVGKAPKYPLLSPLHGSLSPADIDDSLAPRPLAE